MGRLQCLTSVLLSPVRSEKWESEITAGNGHHWETRTKMRLSDHIMNELDTENELGGLSGQTERRLLLAPASEYEALAASH